MLLNFQNKNINPPKITRTIINSSNSAVNPRLKKKLDILKLSVFIPYIINKANIKAIIPGIVLFFLPVYLSLNMGSLPRMKFINAKEMMKEPINNKFSPPKASRNSPSPI